METGSTTQPITNSDAHFLAWTPDGNTAYLKVDSLGSPRVIRAQVNGGQAEISIPEYTYDLAVNPVNGGFTFTISRGLGYGSELHITQYGIRNTRKLYADQYNYISFARFSPDGKQITFIKIPDTQTPFTEGELWIMNSDGSNPRKLANADAGHGYAANWSPDGTKIAFVMRENPGDENANQSSDALISNIYIVDIAGGRLTQITNFENAHAETPHWSPDGNMLAFSGVVDGRMSVFIADITSGEIKPLETEPACCPAWMRK
jgi:Tol biopolymer transport system component